MKNKKEQEKIFELKFKHGFADTEVIFYWVERLNGLERDFIPLSNVRMIS